jgi:hypothetical protein
MFKRVAYGMVCACLAMVMGCHGGTRIQSPLTQEKNLKLLVNLHPEGDKLYSANFQQDGLIPRCSDVDVKSVTDKRVVFTANGQEYTYIKHEKTLHEPWQQHLDKIFGTTCTPSTGMSDIDQKGIKEGRIYKGMSKQGVIDAAGYPPTVSDPMSNDTWKYWRNRFATFIVHFEDGKVSDIDGTY